MAQVLLSETDGRGVTTLALNRPGRHNALDGELADALLDRLELLEQDPATRVLVITGNGRSFCSGADLDWIRQVTAAGDVANREDALRLALLMQRLYGFPRPTVARVNGSAWGGGAGLIACCDIAIASGGAWFGFTEVRLGLVAAVIAPYVLRAIGARNARRFLLSGEQFSARQAQAMGLVHQAVADAELDGVLETQLQALLKGLPAAQAETKRLVQHLIEADREVLHQTAELTARVRAAAEGRRGIQAFLERRRDKGTGTGD